MRTIRASEIAAYLYCNRAWWYQQQGFISENQADLSDGQRLHGTHGRTILITGCLRLLAFAFLLAAVIFFTIYITNTILDNASVFP